MSVMRCGNCEEQFDTDYIELFDPVEEGIEDSKLDHVCEGCLEELIEYKESGKKTPQMKLDEALEATPTGSHYSDEPKLEEAFASTPNGTHCSFDRNVEPAVDETVEFMSFVKGWIKRNPYPKRGV